MLVKWCMAHFVGKLLSSAFDILKDSHHLSPVMRSKYTHFNRNKCAQPLTVCNEFNL